MNVFKGRTKTPQFWTVVSVAAVALVIGVVFGRGWFLHEDIETAPFKRIDESHIEIRKRDQIQVQNLRRELFPETVDLTGKVSLPDQNVEVITARANARVEEVKVQLGDTVTKGQILAVLWSPDLATAAQELAMAQKQGQADLIELTQQKLKNMALSARDANPNSNSFPLRASRGGAVLDKRISPGTNLVPGDVLFTLGKLGTYQFVGDLTPESALRVKKGMKVIFNDDEKAVGAVMNVSPVADAGTNLVRVRCTFPVSAERLVPVETFVKAQIVVSEQPELVAPVESLMLTKNQETVFVEDAEKPNVFVRVPVKVLGKTKKIMGLELSDELKEGRAIVTGGALLLQGILESEED